jgi:hypothetical protein
MNPVTPGPSPQPPKQNHRTRFCFGNGTILFPGRNFRGLNLESESRLPGRRRRFCKEQAGFARLPLSNYNGTL